MGLLSSLKSRGYLCVLSIEVLFMQLAFGSIKDYFCRELVFPPGRKSSAAARSPALLHGLGFILRLKHLSSPEMLS